MSGSPIFTQFMHIAEILLSLLSPWLSSPCSLNHCSHVRCCSPLNISMALHWTGFSNARVSCIAEPSSACLFPLERHCCAILFCTILFHILILHPFIHRMNTFHFGKQLASFTCLLFNSFTGRDLDVLLKITRWHIFPWKRGEQSNIPALKVGLPATSSWSEVSGHSRGVTYIYFTIEWQLKNSWECIYAINIHSVLTYTEVLPGLMLSSFKRASYCEKAFLLDNPMFIWQCRQALHALFLLLTYASGPTSRKILCPAQRSLTTLVPPSFQGCVSDINLPRLTQEFSEKNWICR